MWNEWFESADDRAEWLSRHMTSMDASMMPALLVASLAFGQCGCLNFGAPAYNLKAQVLMPRLIFLASTALRAGARITLRIECVNLKARKGKNYFTDYFILL